MYYDGCCGHVDLGDDALDDDDGCGRYHNNVLDKDDLSLALALMMGMTMTTT